MLAIAGNLRLGTHETRRAYLGATPVFAAEQTRWGTDFSEYSMGSAPSDWTMIATDALETWEITSGGLISSNRMRLRQSLRDSGLWHFAFSVWDAVPEVEDSEVLLLAQRGASSNSGNLHGVLQRATVNSATNSTGLVLAARNGTTDLTMRRMASNDLLDADNTAHGDTYIAGHLFWMRCRWDGSRYRMKGWLGDSDAGDLGLTNEPSSWQFNGTLGTLAGTGKIGFLQRANRSTPEQNEVFVHYFGVGIDGDSAPSPTIARSPVPDPDPDPAPDLGISDTFDSTTTSFDSTAHTLDEVV
jgi:hypothetical protein